MTNSNSLSDTFSVTYYVPSINLLRQKPSAGRTGSVWGKKASGSGEEGTGRNLEAVLSKELGNSIKQTDRSLT